MKTQLRTVLRMVTDSHKLQTINFLEHQFQKTLIHPNSAQLENTYIIKKTNLKTPRNE